MFLSNLSKYYSGKFRIYDYNSNKLLAEGESLKEYIDGLTAWITFESLDVDNDALCIFIKI